MNVDNPKGFLEAFFHFFFFLFNPPDIKMKYMLKNVSYTDNILIIEILVT